MTTGMSFAFVEVALGDPNMSSDKEGREPSIDPVPCTPSDEDINKAQAIREALRKLLLNRQEPEVAVYWAVSAD